MICSVKGFHQSFAPIHEIPVATVATAWDDLESGQTFILIIHQALYFGKQLDHSLVNPNQIRVTGIPVCDDPFNCVNARKPICRAGIKSTERSSRGAKDPSTEKDIVARDIALRGSPDLSEEDW
jgi:hypothetical protein